MISSSKTNVDMKTTIEGLSEKFNKEYWNYAKLISGVLRWRMPIDRVIKLVDSLQLDSENINTWKKRCRTSTEKKYVTDGTSAEGQKLSQLRQRNSRISRRMLDLQDLWHIKMWIMVYYIM